MHKQPYEFNLAPDRTNTGSLKWDHYPADVLPMWVADMDFHVAPEIVAALTARANHKIFGYTIPYDSVIESVVNYLQRVHQFTIQPEWLVWLPGLVPALNVTCRAFGEANSEVLTCSPVYPPFFSSPVNQHRTCISSPLKLVEGRWTFDFDDLESKVTANTKLFLLCNPHNPVARVFTKEELQQLCEFCQRHDLIICSDEIHCDMLFSGQSHIVTATLSEEISARTITLMAPSKTYNVPGLSCAYAVIPNPKIRAAFNKAASGFITEVNAFGYIGCEAAYNHGEPWRKELMATLESNRDFLFDFLDQHIPEIGKTAMEATYLAWLNIEAVQKEFGIKNVVKHFESAGVGLSPGSAFGDDRFVRLNFGCPRSTLEEGLNRMAKSLNRI